MSAERCPGCGVGAGNVHGSCCAWFKIARVKEDQENAFRAERERDYTPTGRLELMPDVTGCQQCKDKWYQEASPDPAMAAFIEDRRAAMRKALNPPKPFELGTIKLRCNVETCPCCKSSGVVRLPGLSWRDCPECNGSGWQYGALNKA